MAMGNGEDFYDELESGSNFGRFEGDVIARWEPDGRSMTLIKPFAYVAPDATRWEAPTGATVNGASIPQFAWSIIGGPFEDRYRNASVIHDVACDIRRRPWQTVHGAFYTAMRAGGVGIIKAKIMYAAVYHFGPRWPLQLHIGQRAKLLVRSTITSMVNASADLVSPLGINLPRRQVVLYAQDPVRTAIQEPSEAEMERFDNLASQIEQSEGSIPLTSIRRSHLIDEI